MTRKPFFRPHLAFSRDRPDAGSARDVAATAEEARRFRELVLPHMDAAYNYARYLARDATAAEDLVQDAFLKAFRAFGRFRGESAKAWLLAIVRNGFLTRAAAERVARTGVVAVGDLSPEQAEALAQAPDLDADTPERALIRRRDAALVRETIAALPEPFRETLVLREMEELSYKEIAALTGTPIGTVMSRLARARAMLADLLLPKVEDGREREVRR